MSKRRRYRNRGKRKEAKRKARYVVACMWKATSLLCFAVEDLAREQWSKQFYAAMRASLARPALPDPFQAAWDNESDAEAFDG